MKTRNDFVSNSSSSSFLVIFDKKLTDKKTNVEDDISYLKEILYKNKESDGDMFDHRQVYSTASLCQIILDQLMLMNKKTLLCFFEEWGDELRIHLHDPQLDSELRVLCDSNVPESVDYSGLRPTSTKEDKEFWQKRVIKEKKRYKKEMKECAIKIVDFFKIKFPDKNFYLANFSDNDGEISAHLEHGGTFDYLPHLTVSHH